MANQHIPAKNKSLTLAFWLNAIFSVIELVGGILTNSTAIISDAIHDFGDALAIGAGIFFEKFSGKKRSITFTYGYRRWSLLSALLLSVMLIVGALIMLWKSFIAFTQPHAVNSIGMLWLAIVGVLINGWAFMRLKKGVNIHDHAHHDHHHSAHHSHNHSHSHNSKAIMLHLLEDVLGWVAVFIGAIIIYYTQWYWIDPLLSTAIAIFVMYNAVKNLIAVMRVMLQAVPEDLDAGALSRELSGITGVKNVHDIHLWSIDGRYTIATFHMVMAPGSNANQLLEDAGRVFKKYEIDHPTVQWESETYHCSLMRC